MPSDSNGRSQLTPMTCSTCGRRFYLQHSPVPPFCSERCQLIDLGHWLDESIGVPFEGDSGDSPVEYRDDDDDRDDDRDDSDDRDRFS
jgi:uncharacterized protein